jgi:hypothetical protein
LSGQIEKSVRVASPEKAVQTQLQKKTEKERGKREENILFNSIHKLVGEYMLRFQREQPIFGGHAVKNSVFSGLFHRATTLLFAQLLVGFFLV